MNEKKNLNRRDFLRLSGLATAGVLAAACAPSQPVAAPAAASGGAAATVGGMFMNFEANNREQWGRIPADHKVGTLVKQADWYKILGDVPKETVEVAGFKGGWGELWIDAVLDSMKTDFSGVQFNKDFDPRIWEKMKPRLVAGEVPDWNYYVLGPWGGEWKSAVEEKLVVPLDFLLDLEVYGMEGQSVRDVMYPGSLETANGGLTDAQWTMPLSTAAMGIYYNADLFEKNGWPAPDSMSWEDFMAFCAEVAKVIPPFTYAGKYPSYWQFPVVDQLWYKKAGAKAICDMDNLVEGSFLNDDIVWAVEQIQTIFKNGWIYEGSDAMTHTESQQIFVDGKCAMIPNGSWMPNEQAATTPVGFRMKFSGVPAPKDSKGIPNALALSVGSAELQVGNGANPLWGMEVMRRIFSPTVQQVFAEKIGSPMPTKDMLGADAKVSDVWKSTIEVIKKSEGNNIIISGGIFYPTLYKAYGDQIGDIWTGKISAKDAMGLVERSAKEIREDDTITKITKECKA